MLLVLVGLLVAGIFYYDMTIEREVILGLGVACVLGIKFTELHRMGHYYKVTCNHLLHSKGIISKDVKRVFLPTISDIDLQQSFFQRIFNYGTVVVYRYGEKGVIEIKNINSPMKFIKFLQDKMSNISSG